MAEAKTLAEIQGVAKRQMRSLARRVHPTRAGRDAQIVKLARLGWIQEEIAKVIEVSQQSVSHITKNTDFGEIGKMLSEDQTMDYIADHYHMDLALAWALRLEGKTDKERFGGSGDDAKELQWGIQEEIAEVVELRQNRVSQIINNANFGEIDKMLSEGHDAFALGGPASCWQREKAKGHKFQPIIKPGGSTMEPIGLEHLGITKQQSHRVRPTRVRRVVNEQ